jgi:hypothetical protein
MEAPEQIELGLADAFEGAVETLVTVTVTETHAVVLQVPWAFT